MKILTFSGLLRKDSHNKDCVRLRHRQSARSARLEDQFKDEKNRAFFERIITRFIQFVKMIKN